MCLRLSYKQDQCTQKCHRETDHHHKPFLSQSKLQHFDSPHQIILQVLLALSFTLKKCYLCLTKQTNSKLITQQRKIHANNLTTYYHTTKYAVHLEIKELK